MIKRLELSTPTSCLNKAAVDEPVFVLRAKDPIAAMTIRHWATMAIGVHEMAKIKEAGELALQMEQWHAKFAGTFPISEPTPEPAE